ncbi:hypothetical protein A9Q84_15460 [Halobacteriovorax marinus]|uniref:Solute-binding protein family 3/N-terminal domain-containing protein n=1 Tax=Halobacteriovorax marinus TaxID=97084 RepID=A0A1Y5F3T2_9BACT|nr:hypothetical protein A9Q84_15460 [Halobacteriovorax marinus]
MLKNILKIIKITILGSLFLSSLTTAAPFLATTCSNCKRPLNVWGDKENPFRAVTILCNVFNEPSCFENIEGEIVGVDVEIIREAFKRLKIPIQFKLAPLRRVLRNIKNGSVDGAISMLHYSEREQFYHYSNNPLHNSKLLVYVNRNTHFEYKSLSDLYGKQIGIRRGYNFSKEFDQAKKDRLFSVVELENSVQLIKMLKKNRLDLIIDKQRTIDFILKTSLGDLKAVGQMGLDLPAYFVFSKLSKIRNKEELIMKIDNILKTMTLQGEISKIVRKYGSYE